jgi:RNA polymerase sigma factor (sigma-70 family)
MTREEEARLVALLPDEKACAQLLAAYMPIIRWMAYRIVPLGRLEDAVQDGAIGFIRSLPHYDPATGNRLTSYARVAVQRAIRRGNIWEAKQTTGHGYRAIEEGRAKPAPPVSLSAPLPGSDSGQSMQDRLVDEDAGEAFAAVEARADAHRVRDALRRVTHRVERQAKATPGLIRAVSSSLYWGEPSIRDVAASYGVSHQAAHIHRARIIAEVKKEMQGRATSRRGVAETGQEGIATWAS